MSNEIPSILHHVSVGTDDLERSCEFYDSVMPHLGASRIMNERPAIRIADGKVSRRSGAPDRIAGGEPQPERDDGSDRS